MLFLHVLVIFKSIMFTIGIFSTHIPYIAFVFCYALILFSVFDKKPDILHSGRLELSLNETVLQEIQPADCKAAQWDCFHFAGISGVRQIQEWLVFRPVTGIAATGIFIMQLMVVCLFNRPPPFTKLLKSQ